MTTVLNHFFVMFYSQMTSGLTVLPDSTLTCSDETCLCNLINSVWPIKYRHDFLTKYVVSPSSFQKAILTKEKVQHEYQIIYYSGLFTVFIDDD